MKKKIEFIVKRMLPGDKSAKLYSLLSMWGFDMNVRPRTVGTLDARRIFWLDDMEKVDICSEDDIGIYSNESRPLKGNAEPWSFDEVTSRDGIYRFVEALDVVPVLERRPSLCITFDFEATDERDLDSFSEFLEEYASDGTMATVFLTGSVLHSVERADLKLNLLRHEIGNHTLDHNRASRSNIVGGHEKISEIFPTPSVFRAPFLDMDHKTLDCLYDLDYRFNSSSYGFAAHPIVGVGSSERFMTEVPLLDGGDYASLSVCSTSDLQYLKRMERKLEELRRYRASFALLFHPQYSDISIWRKAVELAREMDFTLSAVGDIKC